MDGHRGYGAAILRPTEAARALSVRRSPPSAELAGLVDYHWCVAWRTEEEHRQQVVPQPRVHLAAEHGRLRVQGVTRQPFFRTLRGEGHTLGVAFHPGGFRPFLRRDVGSLGERSVPAGELLGLDDRAAAERILATRDLPEMVRVVEAYLTALDPRPDPLVQEVRSLVAVAEQDRSVTRAEQLADRGSMSLRSLQRLFTGYVGIGPKWVITRFRILDAAAAAHGERPVDWSALAAELGFTDQAHLTRAFTAVVGTPPATYRRHA